MTVYSQISIYYFSGTGNSKNVALWLARCAEELHMSVTLTDIARSDRRSIPPAPENTLVVFISPVHGFNYPPITLNFIAHFPAGNNDVVLMNTRAGMLIGKWITPGLSGITFYISALLLRMKGYSIKGMLPVDLPSNWLFVHPGLNQRTVLYLHQMNKEKVTAFGRRIFSGHTDFCGAREIIQDLIVAPVSVLYYCIGRFFLSKTYMASADCDNCGACMKNCPVTAIIEVDHRPFWTYHCESCMKCVGNCPKKAIETTHGFAFGIWALYAFGLALLTDRVMESLSIPPDTPVVGMVIRSAVFIATAFIGYRIIHSLLRYPFINKLVTYTSLSKYAFWGRRYKALKQ